LVAERSGAAFEELSAVQVGRAEVREVIERAGHRRATSGERTILFLDEIHRFNKAQQDALLPHVESGLLTLIGATTENPSFEVIAALLSRARVFVLEPIEPAALARLLRRAVDDAERGLGGRCRATDDVLELIAAQSWGDARRALTTLEVACELCEEAGGGELTAA